MEFIKFQYLIEYASEEDDCEFPGMLTVLNPIHIGERIELFNKKGDNKEFTVISVRHKVEPKIGSSTYLIVQ